MLLAHCHACAVRCCTAADCDLPTPAWLPYLFSVVLMLSLPCERHTGTCTARQLPYASLQASPSKPSPNQSWTSQTRFPSAATEAATTPQTNHKPRTDTSDPEPHNMCTELMLRRPWFQPQTPQGLHSAPTEIGTLREVFGILGTPTPESWPQADALPNYMRFTACPGQPLQSTFPQVWARALLHALHRLGRAAAAVCVSSGVGKDERGRCQGSAEA